MSGHMRNVRLKVLMHQFYAEGDHRRKALVIVQKSWTTVLQLQQHIQKIFRLPGHVYLTVDDGCLLPTDEDIGVVTETDSVTVQPATNQSFALLADAFSNAHIYSANDTTPGAWTSEDVSSPGLGPALRGGQTAQKRQKKSLNFAAADAAIAAANAKSSKWIKDVNSLDDEDEEETKPLDLPPKAKRQRKRKRKTPKPPTTEEIAEQSTVLPTKLTARAETVFRVERSAVVAAGSTKAHIRFGATDEDDVRPSCVTPVASVAPSSPAKNEPFPLPSTARVIRAVRTTTAAARQPTRQTLPTKAKPPSEQSPSVPDKDVMDADVAADAVPVGGAIVIGPGIPSAPTGDAVEHGNESIVDAAPVKAPESDMEKVRQAIATMDLPSVVNPLKEKDMVAFKIMKLSDNYMPGMSEYIVGMVQAIGEDNTISLHIMAGNEETQEPVGKFSLATEKDDDEENELDGQAADRSYHVQREDMFDVKYVQL